VVIYLGKSIARREYPLLYKEYILSYSKEYNIDPYIVASVIKTESNFKYKATSNKNAKGLMQIMDDTSKWIASQMKVADFNVEKIYSPEINIKFGCWYLNSLSKEFNGNIDLVLASYNGGSGNVRSWLKNIEYSKDGQTLDYIPFKETDKYIKKVKVSYKIYKYLYPDFYKNN
jgi:soluble lytic murein transglycosylase